NSVFTTAPTHTPPREVSDVFLVEPNRDAIATPACRRLAEDVHDLGFRLVNHPCAFALRRLVTMSVGCVAAAQGAALLHVPEPNQRTHPRRSESSTGARPEIRTQVETQSATDRPCPRVVTAEEAAEPSGSRCSVQG